MTSNARIHWHGSMPRLAFALALLPAMLACASRPQATTSARNDELLHPPAAPLDRVAPMIEEMRARQQPCAAGRCANEQLQPERLRVAAASLAITGRRSRGSNSQLAIPQNLMLADIDGDDSTDFLQWAETQIFVSKTDFEKTGILHLYMHRPIRRVITGDFHGDGYDQTCVITDDDALVCYGISEDRKELWWWFTQGTPIGVGDDSIVGDFDGDGRDDILVYPRAGGEYRMLSMKGDFFFEPMPAFAAGNLGAATPNLRLRAGDFGGDGRDDLLVVNELGQVLYYASVWDGAQNTFWWAFTSEGGFVQPNDEVTVARIDDNLVDDFVLRDRITGATRFHRLEYGDGRPPLLTGVSTGQLHLDGNSLLFWGAMHGVVDEPGNAYRDDAMAYDLGSNMFIRSDARWDGNQLTYWWVYTQLAPNNHAGWAPYTTRPWLLLKCKLSDLVDEPRDAQFYRELVLGGLTQYWRDLTYGAWDLSGSNVVDAWHTMDVSSTDWVAPGFDRYQRIARCIQAYGGSTAGYVNVIAMVNGEGDVGNAGGGVLVSPLGLGLSFIAHEVAHTFGWGHSYDDTQRKNAPWSAPGEYFDHWDIMSASAVFGFDYPPFGMAGPEMNAPYKARNGLLPAHRRLTLVPTGSPQSTRMNIAAINRPEANGPLLVRIGGDDDDHYTIEYRMKSGWDQGIPQATVLVHRVTNGISYLITADGGPERLVGSTSTYPLGAGSLTVQVHGFAADGYTADVTVEY